MIKMKTLITLAALIAVPLTASAEQQTVKLKVDGMSCVTALTRSRARLNGSRVSLPRAPRWKQRKLK